MVIDDRTDFKTGPMPHVYHHPATTKVAEVFSDPPVNYLPCTVREQTASLGEQIEFPLTPHLQSLSAAQYIFGVRPNHPSLNRNSAEATWKSALKWNWRKSMDLKPSFM